MKGPVPVNVALDFDVELKVKFEPLGMEPTVARLRVWGREEVARVTTTLRVAEDPGVTVMQVGLRVSTKPLWAWTGEATTTRETARRILRNVSPVLSVRPPPFQASLQCHSLLRRLPLRGF